MKKWGGQLDIRPPHSKNWGGRVPPIPPRIDAPAQSGVRRMICHVLKGLRALHAREPRILHRDLKPTNILVNVNGYLVLSDFGI